MLIGELARRTGIPARTIRFYEAAKVLTVPERAHNGYRVYSDRTAAELTFIKQAQRLNFSLDEIREILGLARQGRVSCSRVKALCDAHIAEIDRQMAELRAFRERLVSVQRLAKSGCGITGEGLCQAVIGS